MLVCDKTPDTGLCWGVHAQVLTVAKVTLVPVVGVTILWAVPGCTANTEPTDGGWEIQTQRQERKEHFSIKLRVFSQNLNTNFFETKAGIGKAFQQTEPRK